ncbi:MAG: GGDEF domain-containing protein [Clostridium lundense]|nr:GGDEF domain-containing protein [Clostridium lundense]
MDFQEFVNCVSVPCAVLSVEKTEGGFCGEIRIVCSNRPYKEVMGPKYYDNMPYQELVPRDVKFEDYCFRAAFRNERLNAYVETKALGGWTDQSMVPLGAGDDRLGYVQFLFEFTPEREAERMARVSVDTASTVIKACITMMGAEDLREAVGTVMEDILAETGAASTRIILIDHEKKEAETFCERMMLERMPVPILVDSKAPDVRLPYEIVRSWEGMIGVSNAVIVKDEREMELLARRNPEWVRSLRQYLVDSLVLIPLRRAKKIIGYLYVVNFDVSRAVQTKELLELLSFFLGSEIANYQLLERLDEMSNTDALTGVGNRNALAQRVRRLAGKPFGVIELDLNGLKTVNDRDGHGAGDLFIRRAAELFVRQFGAEDVYRSGGDEFVVIADGVTREELERRLDALRERANGEGVSFAAGAFWSGGETDMHHAFLIADERMYADKKAFYRDHPEGNRRTGQER